MSQRPRGHEAVRLLVYIAIALYATGDCLSGYTCCATLDT